MDVTEKYVSHKSVFKGRIMEVQLHDIILQNGDKDIREIIIPNGGASVLPIDEEGNVYLVRQFRYPISGEALEIPAGKLNTGESHIDCAKRELKEETGLEAESVELLAQAYLNPAYIKEKAHIFIATKLKKGRQNLDEDEFLDVVKMPFKEAYKMVEEGRLPDAKTQLAILKAADFAREKGFV